jgi:branched-chain amino acid transport system permease protein
VQHFVNPTPFSVQASIEYLFMTVAGGGAQIFGALIGASLFSITKQELQNLLEPIFGPTARLEMLFFAVLIIAVLQGAREGLWPFILNLLNRFSPQPRTPSAALPASRRIRPAKGLTVLKAEALQRSFGGLVAVDSVSFDVKSGEILGVLGPNGAGKSTLFNLISGALSTTRGNIIFLGTPVANATARSLCRRGMARTFQHAKLVPGMSLIENVALGAHHLGRRGAAAASFGLDAKEEQALFQWAQHLLERVGLGDKTWDPARSLPLGHQRMLEVARALAADPALLLLDEPAAGLRVYEKERLASLLKELRSEGLATLLVEHDIGFVTSLADRLMVMNFGRRIAFGEPGAVCADRQVQEAYLGMAA